MLTQVGYVLGARFVIRLGQLPIWLDSGTKYT